MMKSKDRHRIDFSVQSRLFSSHECSLYFSDFSDPSWRRRRQSLQAELLLTKLQTPVILKLQMNQVRVTCVNPSKSLQILSFLLTRGSPVGTNNLLIKEEAFCQRKWKAIGASADETWEARLYDTTSLIENVPPELLPHHYLLSNTYIIWVNPKKGRYTMKLSKHGNQLVSASSSEHSDSNMHFQEVWDLTLRKCIQKGSFESNREILGSSTWGLLDCGRYVLVSDWQSLRMCTIQGELLHTLSPQRGHRGRASISANKLFLPCDDDDRDSIANLDLVTGAVENRVVSWASGAWARHLLMKMFGNLLVVLRAHIVEKDGRLIRHHEQGLVRL